jgi:serine protease Do
MTRPLHFGPALVVLLAAAAVLFAVPESVRRIGHARTEVEVRAAAERLARSTILEQFNAATRDIATVIEPSVVHIATSGRVAARGGMQPYLSTGSGWVYDALGHVITNAHVVDGASRVQVQFHHGETFDAELVGMDLRTDIAVLRVKGAPVSPAARGDSDDLRQGDLVFAFGSPFDFRFSMSKGIVSGLGRSAGLEEIDYENFIQVDAAINPGNSGGPLTDIRGRVVGMNTAIATGRGNSMGQGQFAGIGLAIPLSMIESVADQVIEFGEVAKGFVGITVAPLEIAASLASRDPDLAFVAERFRGSGAVITSVTAGGPAERGGLRPGDVITAIDGQRITSRELVPALVSSRRPGERVQFEVWRGDRERDRGELIALAIELDRLAPGINSEGVVRGLQSMGLRDLDTLTPAQARTLGIPYRRGVVVLSIDDSFPLAEAMPAGTVIVAVMNQPVRTIDDLYTRINRNLAQMGRGMRGRELLLSVVSPQGEERMVAVPLR